MTLTIARLRTRLTAGTPIDPARVGRWERQFAAQDGDALASRWVHGEEWLLIRRLPMQARWRGDDADVDVGRAWSDGLAHAIEEALARDDGNCVRYPHVRAALADLLYRSSLDDPERQWAWHRMGLIGRPGVSCEDALRAGVETLARAPEATWPVLMRLVDGEETGASLTAVLRSLPASCWARLLGASPRTAPYLSAAGDADAARTASAPVRAASGTGATEPSSTANPSREAQALLRWAAARPYLVRSHVETLTVLVAAMAWPPEAVHARVLQQRLAFVRTRLAETLPAPSSQPVRQAGADGERAAERRTERPSPGVPRTAPGGRGGDRAGDRAVPDLPEPARGLRTHSAGALFWLGRIAASGVLETLAAVADAPDAPDGDALRLFLRELARLLDVPDDDPALAAFCGGTVPQAPAPGAIVACAESLAARWTAWLDEEAPDLAEPRMTTVCRRDGRLVVEPGWVDLHLPLSGADAAIRRLGLDLDPGWLPWLSCVLRIRYDDE